MVRRSLFSVFLVFVTGCAAQRYDDETTFDMWVEVKPSEIGGCEIVVRGEDSKSRGSRKTETREGGIAVPIR